MTAASPLSAHLAATGAAPQAALAARSRDLMTRVALAFVPHRINIYLRFGRPAREVSLDRWRRCALFAPGLRLCRIRWEANEHGTTTWQLLVLQTGSTGEPMQGIPGVTPGALVLLRAEGEKQIHQVLEQIDAVEALGIDAADAAPLYWRTLHNRLAARLPLTPYTIERHAAYFASEGLR